MSKRKTTNKRLRSTSEQNNSLPIKPNKKIIKKSEKKQSEKKRSKIDDFDDGTMILLPRKNDDVDWSQWVPATATRNYLLEDGILDLLQFQGSALTKTNVDYQNSFIKIIGSNPDNFVAAIMEQGLKFERKVISEIIKKLGEKNVINIGGDTNPRSREKYLQTIQEMKNGKMVIYQGVVRNYENKTYGIPDLLIRSDVLPKIFSIVPYIDKIKNKFGKYHYVVVDIKCKTLHLKADGMHLRNDGPIKAYKAQLCVYNEALGIMQGYRPPAAFILGWKWKYTQQRSGVVTEYHGDSCFDRLGRIDYEESDKEYSKKTEEAIKWILDVRKNGHTWDLSKLPLPRPELYPNMCNPHDYPYGKIKRDFAENIDEISLVWKCGTKHRRKAHDQGIYSWKDPRCTPELLGIGGDFTNGVITTILEANRSDQNVIPKIIQNNFCNWKNPGKFDFFVDFEMTCSVFSDFDDICPSDASEEKQGSLIFMIGVGHLVDQQWVYKSFVVDRLDAQNEMKICRDFVEYMFTVSGGMWNNIYHWSPAEPVAWNRAFVRDKNFCYLSWVDLLKVFHTEPIGVKGCLNYGLKNIAKALYGFGYIKSTWDTQGPCVDGADAAVGAYKVEQETKLNGVSFAQHPLIQEIVKYNEIDCKVLQEILDYLRTHHTTPPDSPNERKSKRVRVKR